MDELLQMRVNPGVSQADRYLLSDLLYRSVALTDTNPTPAIVEAYDTDAYGNTLAYSSVGPSADWFADDAATTSAPVCRSIFTGRSGNRHRKRTHLGAEFGPTEVVV